MGFEIRQAFAVRLVRFHLDELNGILDRIAFLAVRQDLEARRDLALAAARCAEMLGALAWNRGEVVRYTWSEAERPPEREEDLAGAALVLRALDADRDRCRAWMRGLPAEARRRVAEALRELRKHEQSVALGWETQQLAQARRPSAVKASRFRYCTSSKKS